VPCQTPSDGACLLLAEIQGKVLFVFVVLPEILAGFLVHHSQDAGNRLAHGVNFREFRC